MDQTNHVIERVRSFVQDKFPLARKRAPGAGDDLLQSGVVDSLGVLDLVTFLEKEFMFTISDDELTPENFSSIVRIAAFVLSRTGIRSGAMECR